MDTRITAAQREARTAQLLSGKQIGVLRASHVMVFGLGGVGGSAVETLGRMGIGKLTIVDKDCFEPSNINRQIGALMSTVGKSKADVTKQRLLDINPDAQVTAVSQFHLPETPVTIPDDVDLVIDAVDTVSAKLLIVETCKRMNIPVIASMGMGNRMDPTQVKLGDVFETSNCALSRVMRKELRKRGINTLRCVYSTEDSRQNQLVSTVKGGSRPTPGSVAFVPPVAGLLMAYDAVKSLLRKADTEDQFCT